MELEIKLEGTREREREREFIKAGKVNRDLHEDKDKLRSMGKWRGNNEQHSDQSVFDTVPLSFN